MPIYYLNSCLISQDHLKKQTPMNVIEKIEGYGDSHHPRWLTFFRVALGLLLIVKGYDFMLHKQMLTQFFDHNFVYLSFILIPLIGPIHMVGGCLIAFGLITRISAGVQLPIVLGAVLFVNAPNAGLIHPSAELLLSLAVLLLLVVFMIFGSGTVSADAYLKEHENDR